MPVRLDAVPKEKVPPTPPRPIVWALLFVCFLSAGAALTLYFWPRGTPTTGGRFWLYLVVLPILAWVLVFGVRLIAYEYTVGFVQEWNQNRKARLQSETLRGQRPLFVFASAYECGLGSSELSAKLENEASGLQPFYASATSDPVQCSRLSSAICDSKHKETSLQRLFAHMLKHLDPQLKAIPAWMKVQVALQIDSGADVMAIGQAWTEAAEKAYPALSEVKLIEAREGLMSLDRWLDVEGSSLSRTLLLVVSAQLRPSPEDGTGEAAVAMLVSSRMREDDLVELGQKKLNAMATLHRPVEFSQTDAHERLVDALRWGERSAQSIESVWTAGLGPEHQSAVGSAFGAVKIADDIRKLDIDSALGLTGVVAGWLTVGAAVERCQKEKQPQLCAAEEDRRGRFFIVAPV